MKRVLFTSVVMSVGFSLAQTSAKPMSHRATADEFSTSLQKNIQYHQSKRSRPPSVAPFRPVEDTAHFAYILMSEMEPSSDITQLRKTIAQNLPKGVTLVILADTADVDLVKTEYSAWMDTRRLIVVSDPFTEYGLWARDAFPVPVYANAEKKVSLVSAKYFREFKSSDSIAEGVQASHLEKKDFIFVGGNLISDEDGNCFSVQSSRLFGADAQDLISAYGCKTHHMLPHAAGIGDVDEVIKPLPGHRMLTNISIYKPILESLGYQVSVLPSAGGYRTFINSLIVNNIVFMPAYRISEDDEAQSIYEKLGYKVFPVPSRDLSDRLQGSIHCQTMAYPAMDPSKLPADDAAVFLKQLLKIREQ